MSLFDNPKALRCQFEAAGNITLIFLNEEGEGQEDKLNGEDRALGDEKQRLRTSAIFRWTLNYIKVNE